MMTIRGLEPADFQRGFLETLSTLAPVNLTMEQAIEIYSKRTGKGIQTIVAVVEERVAGTATLIIEPKFIHGGGVVGHIEDVVVHADFGGRGVGKAMLDHLLELGKKEGCYKLILNCHDPLVSFYVKAGYRRHDNGMRIDLRG